MILYDPSPEVSSDEDLEASKQKPETSAKSERQLQAALQSSTPQGEGTRALQQKWFNVQGLGFRVGDRMKVLGQIGAQCFWVLRFVTKAL